MTHPADRIVAWLPDLDPPWWIGPALFAAMGTLAVIAAALVSPVPGTQQLTAFGEPFGGTCSMIQLFGIPCAQCGMTRSWVWLVRGQVALAFTYNAAGASLLLSLVWMGVTGWVRLLTRKPRALALDWRIASLWWALWAAVLLMGLWILRLNGVNPLPAG